MCLFLLAVTILFVAGYFRCVKLTSPILNVVIFVGAIFFYVDIILFGINNNLASNEVVDGLCQVRLLARGHRSSSPNEK